MRLNGDDGDKHPGADQWVIYEGDLTGVLSQEGGSPDKRQLAKEQAGKQEEVPPPANPEAEEVYHADQCH